MKRLIILLMVASSYSYAQPAEFPQYANGLMYDEPTMNRLEIIIDSLNVRFRGCELSHAYYSLFQGNATWVELSTAGARAQVRKGITLAEFENNYPEAIKSKEVWITKSYYTGYKDEPMINYASLVSRGKRPDIHVKRQQANDKTSGWIVDQYEKSALFLHALQQTEIPYAYARLVQYVDCMIDTTALVMLPGAEQDPGFAVDRAPKANEFITWAARYPNEPELDHEKIKAKVIDRDSAFRVFHAAHDRWDSLRLLNLDTKMKKAYYYKSLLAEAVEEGILKSKSDPLLEFYVARYGSKADALTLMRNRRVMGYCSMDSRPRKHAMKICLAAAETAQWDIFLRSHLDIMNDRFDRMSDGSYAWAGRKTYLKELEELGIPALDLLLGISLRVSNVSKNHYLGNISRVGRALTDASDKDTLENRIISMMQDSTLDVYNRTMMALVFDHYTNNLQDATRRTTNRERLEATIKTMPQQIQEVWAKKK